MYRKRRIIVGALVVGALLVGALGNSSDQTAKINTVQDIAKSSNLKVSEKPSEKIVPICDGKTVTESCSVDGINYKSYVYHPAVKQKTHTETLTTYKEEVTGYCTLCNDGTYSPSCATGRGACSWHGGVAQWDAPRTSRVPIVSTKVVVDAPAEKAYYEKVLK